MRKAARTVKPNARTGERHTWKDRERRRKEERQRMAAEALIVEDAYQRGYADAIADMRKKKEQRRQREQAKKARRWYFIKQKAYGLAMLAVTVLAVWATEGDITIAVITVQSITECARAGRTQQASWGRLRRWKMQRALARRVILYMMITARRYIPQRGSRQAQAFRLAYR